MIPAFPDLAFLQDQRRFGDRVEVGFRQLSAPWLEAFKRCSMFRGMDLSR